jgi:Glycosyltransferase family 28 C-terminal domain
MDAAQITLGRWLPHGTDLILSLISSGIPMCPQTMSQILPRRVFVTVGSTRFDALVQAVLTPQVIEMLKSKMFSELVIQCGESELGGIAGGSLKPLGEGETRKAEVLGLQVELFKFKPSLEEDYDRASLIIGHGGEFAPLFLSVLVANVDIRLRNHT